MRNNPYSNLTESLLQTIVQAQSCFIKAESISQSFDVILNGLLALTGSTYGFIGEKLETQEGKPYLQTHAFTNVAWNEETRALYNQFAPNLEFTNLGILFGKVLTTGKHVIANSLSSDPRREGLPEGHPPLEAFLGVPFYCGHKLVGMAGIANRSGGYDEDLIEFLQPLVSYCGTLIEGNRNEQARSQIEIALRESEQRFELAIWGSNDGIWDWPNIEEDTEWWSPRFYELLGYEFEEIPPSLSSFSGLLHPEDRDRVFQAVRAHLEKESPFDIEYRLRLKEGTYRWFYARGKAVKNAKGVVTRMAGSIQDIHDRRQAEISIRESETRFRTVSDTAPVLIWMSDTEKNCTYVNQRWLDFTGRILDQELGNGWVENIHPEDKQRCLAICEAAFLNRIPLEMEFRLRHKNRGYRWVIDRGVPRFDSDGKFLGFIGTCVDISEQKHHEQSIARYNQMLQGEIEERTTRIHELEQRRMQVEKLAALSQVTAGIAHEINNPLASIQQSLHLVKAIIPLEHPRAHYVPKIEQEIQRIATIIKQMYQLYRPHQEHPRLINLNQVVKEASELIVSLHKNSHGELHQEFSRDMFDLPLPATELHQVICNVLQNAFDAVEEKGIVSVRTGLKSGAAWIRIQDNGPGIDPEILSHIFEPFYSTKINMKRNGMGLGLSVSKSLVEAMGGNIDVNSTPDQGTIFTISFALPLVPAFFNSHQEHTSRALVPMS
jgi:PAS domain S-box-containing protein